MRPSGSVAHAQLQREVGDDRREVAVAGALAVAVDRALHLAWRRRARRPARWPRAQPVSSWQWMPIVDVVAEVAARPRATIALDLVRQRAAVGVAQHERGRRRCIAAASSTRRRTRGCACSRRRSARRRRTPAGPSPVRNSTESADHRHALVERGLQRLGDVVVPALADDAHRRRAGLDQVAQRGSSSTLPFGAPGRAEGHQRRRRRAAARCGARGRTRRPSGWRRASRPRCSARRGSRAARRCAACRRR